VLEKAKWPMRDGEYRFTADEVMQVRALVAAKWAPAGTAAPAGGSAIKGGAKGGAAPVDQPMTSPKAGRGAPTKGAAVPKGKGHAAGVTKAEQARKPTPAVSPAPAGKPPKGNGGPVRSVRRK
jgi:hypothetical protein